MDTADHSGAWLLLFPAWLQLRVLATLQSFLVDLFVPKIKLHECEREHDHHWVKDLVVIPIKISNGTISVSNMRRAPPRNADKDSVSKMVSRPVVSLALILPRTVSSHPGTMCHLKRNKISFPVNILQLLKTVTIKDVGSAKCQAPSSKFCSTHCTLHGGPFTV